MHDAVLVDPGQCDAAGVGAEVGPHLVQSALHPGVDVVGVQVVQHQQRSDQLVVGQLPPGLCVEVVTDPVQAGAVQGAARSGAAPRRAAVTAGTALCDSSSSRVPMLLAHLTD